MSKFGSLAARVSETFHVELIDPVTQEAIRDQAGNAAFIEVLSADSEEGRAFDRERAVVFRKQAARTRSAALETIDQFEENIAKCARLTRGWHLVDPATQDVLDVKFSRENARELYSEPGMNWLFMQVWVAANDAANFMRRSSTTSMSSPSIASATQGA
jgi:hypothetical protein